MTYEELTPDEKHYYNRLDSWGKERYLKTIPIVRGAMEAVDAGEKGLSHPRLINWEEKRLAWENRVILAEEKRSAAEANRVYVKVEIDPSKDERFKNYIGRYGAVRSD
ncbi:hypothetical protein [Symbiopectobacterium purcellii]|uniref:hypothetical protein n=1 Tax=Symbiopectobacterium purcellii TaxID=2871826 RepID=UPI003F82E2C0